MTGEIDRTIVQPAAEAGRDRHAHWLLWLGAGLALAGVVWLAVQLFAQRSEISSLQQQSSSLQHASDSRGADVGKLAEQVKRLGGTPVVQPPAGTGAAQVDPAELRQAARQAVATYCASRNQCRGADGVTPDFDALTNAVLARIPVPKDGTDGKNGRDALVPDYAALVASYCDSHDQCRGLAGANGATGPVGPAGPTCPDGYELRDAVITAPDGTTYEGKACVDPDSSTPPATHSPIPGG